MEKVGEVVCPSGGRGRSLVLASLLLAAAILLSLMAAASDAGAEEITGSLTPTEAGTSRTVTFSSPGDHAALSVPVSAGESVSMVTSKASVSGTYRLDWLNPKGEYVRTWYPSGEAGGFFEPVGFSEAGTATLLIDPEGTATGSITFTLYDASDRTGSISTAGGGETKTFTIGAPGQRQLVHFAGTEGQHVSLVPSNADLEGEFHVDTPAGEWLEGSGGTLEGMHGPLTLPETGTYTVVLTGDGAQTGSVALGIHLPVVPPVGAAQGPVAAYSFDEGEGSTVEDLTGDGHTATIHGAKWTTDGRYGGAMEFNAEEEDYLSIPGSSELDLNEEFTLEAWVRPVSASAEYEPLITRQVTGSPAQPYFLYEGSWDANAPYGGTNENTEEGAHARTEKRLPLRAWSHVALTFDGSRSRLYVNGELVASAATLPPITSEGDIEIGGAGEVESFFDGRIDEVRLYDRALSPAEVGLDMETPLQTPRSGPVAAWSFDEGKGTTAEDLTGNGHTATLKKVTWARGRFGDAVKFDGKSSCVSVAASPELDFEEEFTLEAWVRPIGSGGEEPLMVQEDEAAGPAEEGFVYDLLGSAGEAPKAWIRKPGSGYHGIYGSGPLPKEKWSHVALTDDGAHLRLYVNGELVQTTWSPPLTTGSGPLLIGCDIWGGHFDGRIDEARVYGRALTAGEVESDMESPIQSPKTGPVAAYSFDEGSGETVEDLTGDGHTATIEGAKWTTHGKYGGALEFDAEEEDFVSIPASGALDGTEELTVEAWVRPDESPEWGSILMKEREGSGPGYSYALYQHHDQTSGYFEETEEGVLISPEHSLPRNTWTHLAITDDGAWSRLYVNGELVDTESALPIEGHGEIRLGGNSIWGEYFDGRIDEVRIYDRGLDAAEVDADMETPLQTPKSGPVAAYSFDEGEGGTVTDVTGHGHTATIEGATWTEHGKYGGAMEFDGEGAQLSVPDSPELRLGEEFTLEAWVRPDQIRKLMPVVAKTAPGEDGYALYAADEDEPTVPQGELTEGEYVHGYAYSPEVLSTDTWTHLAVTFDGARLRFYVDGRLVDVGAAEELPIGEGPLTIGGDEPFAGGGFFDGRIDELRIYGRALDTTEVATDMEVPIQTPQRGPIAAWSFDEGEGATTEDITGNGHDGTIEGAEWVRGKYGDGLRFDGPGNVVKVPNSPEFALTEAFTLEAWVRPESESNRWAPILAKELGGGEAANKLAWWLYESDWEADEPYGGTEPQPGEENYAVSDDPLPVGAWSHVALTWDGSKVRLYVDGELVDCSPVAPAGAPPVTEGELEIGAATENGDHFLGRIDEPRIYDRALPEAEVKASMAALPQAATTEAIGAEEDEAVMIGTVNSHGLPTEYQFEYGPTQRYGTTVPEFDEEEIVSDRPEEVEEVAEELQPETTYHYRVVATNAAGRAVGEDQTFTTGPAAAQPQALGAEKSEKKYPGFANMMWSGNFAKMGTKSVMNDVAGSGARMLRLVIPGIDAEIEKIFRLAAEAHVTILPYITQGFYNPTNTEWATEWKAKVKAIVERFGKGGTFWTENSTLPKMEPEWLEVWNEENYGPANGNTEALPSGEIVHRAEPKEFGEVLQLAHEEIAAITAPGESQRAKILVGGLLSLKRSEAEEKQVQRHPGTATPLMSPGSFIRKMGHVADYDAVAVHPYAFAVKGKQRPKNTAGVIELTEKVKRNLKKVRAAMDWIAKKEEGETARERPIWVTEIGFPVHTDSDEAAEDKHHLLVSEQVQAELLTHVFNMMKNKSAPESEKGFDISRAFYYNIQDFVDNHHMSWDYRCGLREDDAGNYVVLNAKNEPVMLPDGKPKEAPTREHHQYRPAFFAFEKEAEITGEYP